MNEAQKFEIACLPQRVVEILRTEDPLQLRQLKNLDLLATLYVNGQVSSCNTVKADLVAKVVALMQRRPLPNPQPNALAIPQPNPPQPNNPLPGHLGAPAQHLQHLMSCMVCHDNPLSMTFSLCGHTGICGGCKETMLNHQPPFIGAAGAIRWTRCPFCREAHADWQINRIFFVN